MTATLTGTSFSSRTVPWMKIGAVIDGDVSSQEAARIGGIDFDVELRSISFHRPEANTWRRVAKRFAVVRQDTDEFFDVVSDRYAPVQYREAFEFMDGINPRYVAAGPLSGGRQAFMVVQLPGAATFDPFPAGDVERNPRGYESDPHDLYVVLRTSHDRSKGIEVALLPLRNRCMNQLALRSFARDAPQSWSVKHIGDPLRRLQEAQRVLARAPRYVEVYANQVRQLASVSVSSTELREVVRKVLPDRPKRDEQLDAITRAFRDSSAVGFGGTGWGAVNAVSEYFEHGRDSGSRTDQARFTGGLNGDTKKYVTRVAQLLANRA